MISIASEEKATFRFRVTSRADLAAASFLRGLLHREGIFQFAFCVGVLPSASSLLL